MEKYTLYCTEQQTKKALELGAPIMTFGYGDLGDAKEKILSMNKQAEISTAENGSIIVGQIPISEEMIGWLEEQEDILGVCIIRDYGWFYQISLKDAPHNFSATFHSRKEATLAAIDAALEYLSNQKSK